MGDHIPQRTRGTPEVRQQGRQDSDDEVDGGQLWDAHHQVEYLRLEGEFGEELSPQPSSSAECVHRVSPLDPNLSSAARYSPPPPYSSPVTGIEASLDHPDSPMEDLSNTTSLPIIPTCVSSSISSATGNLVHSESHRLVHSSPRQVPGRRTTSFVSPNSLFSTPPPLPHSQPCWVPHNAISDSEEEDEEVVAPENENNKREPPALSRSIWGNQKGLVLRSIIGNESSPAGSSSFHSVSPNTPSVLVNNSQPGPSGVQPVLQSTSSCTQSRSLSGSGYSKNLPQPTPSSALPLPSSNKIPAQHHESDSSDSDYRDDASSDKLCSTQRSGVRRRIVQLNDGEAEPLSGPASGCEASSTLRGHVMTPLSSPSTPADNCIVSSSTGHIDSIPPTPAEFQGNDVSGPCSPVSPSLASVAILDSTVDSTSGREIINSEEQSCDDESDDNIGASEHIELPVIVDEGEEISTSQVNLQHSDDSQDVELLVNPQGMFATGRASANNFIEHLSLSLSHFSTTSLDSGINGVNEHRIPSNTLTPSDADAGPYLSDPLSTPGPSRVSLPCSSQIVNRQIDTPTSQNINQPSISSTHNMPDAVEVLDGSLPLLDITSALPECSTVSPPGHLNNDARPEGLESVVSLENESSDMAENQDEIDPLVSLADTVHNSANSENLSADSGNQDFNHLTPAYVLKLPDTNSAGSDDALNSACDQDELGNVDSKKRGYHSPITTHQSLLEPETVTGDSLNNSLGISLATSEARRKLGPDSPLPGPSQDHTVTQQLITSQTNQVSLLVDGSNDSSDGPLLMMVTSHPHSLQRIVDHEKPVDKEESSSLTPCLDGPSFKNNPCDEEVPPSSQVSENTKFPKLSKIITSTDDKDVKAEFIGADFWCGECRHMYTNKCPTHNLQDSDKSGKMKELMSHSEPNVISQSVSEIDGCVDCEEVNNHECSQYHIQAISDKPVRARARASLPAQHLAIRKIVGTEELGVFTRKIIPKRTRFGPLEGVMTDASSFVLSSNGLIYSIQTEEETYFLDISDEGSSNWMRFVRKATNYLEQNCVVMQSDGALVFLTSADILPRTELRVGYSKHYATQRNLHFLQPTQQEISVLESMRKSWLCYECDEGFESSAKLQQHLTCHDEIAEEDEPKKRKRLKTWRPRINGEAETSTKRVIKRSKMSGEESTSVASSQIGIKSPLHVSKGEDPQHHQCKICSRAFTMPDLLKIHHLIHQTVEIKEEFDGISLKEESKTCPQCSKIFESEVELSSHVEEHSFYLPVSTKPYKCEFCYKSFLRRDRLEAHTVVHGNEAEKPFRCNLCQRRFCSNSALNTHIKFHIEGSKGYDCPICREGFFSVASLKAHVSTHCVNEQFKCPTCNKVFPTYSKIRRHIRSYHAILPHTCSICSKEMPSIDKLKIHMLSHSDRRDYLCQDCGKRFKRKDKMREHSKRMHSSDRDARASKAATKAPSKFVPKVDPTDYMQFEYKCHTCLLGFKRRGMLVNHLAKRHPNVDMTSVPELNQPILKATRCYYCQYCEKMYRSSSKRKLHILKYHPGEELPPSSTTHKESKSGDDSTYSQTVGAVTTYPHPCKWCYRQYASRARLLRHQRHQHPDVSTDSSSIKDYDKHLVEPGVSDMDPLDRSNALTEEISLGNQIVGEDNLIQSNQMTNIPRGEPSTSGVQSSEDDLLTQAMGEITPIGNGDQYVRLIGTGGEGQQVMVGTTQANRPLLVSSDASQQGTTLALVTTDNADTVTLSLPAGQFISLIPGLSVSGPASVVTPDTRAAPSDSESAHLDQVEAQENRTTNQELQGEILSSIRMDPNLSKEETVEQVVLTTHQSSNSVVWQQTLSFANTST